MESVTNPFGEQELAAQAPGFLAFNGAPVHVYRLHMARTRLRDLLMSHVPLTALGQLGIHYFLTRKMSLCSSCCSMCLLRFEGAGRKGDVFIAPLTLLR